MRRGPYEELALVDVLAPPVGVLDLLAEDQRHLEEEEVPLTALADQGLGVPHLEGVLQDQLPLGLQVLIKTWEETRRVLGSTYKPPEQP